MSDQTGIGAGIALSLVMFAAAGVYNTVQDRRPANACAVNASGGIDVIQTETRSMYPLGDVKQTFQISASKTGNMSVTVMEPPAADYDLFKASLTTRRWQDSVTGTSDNYVQDYQEARTLVGQCAGNLGVKLSEAPQLPAQRLASLTAALKK